MIKSVRLTKKYEDGQLALNDVSFEVHPGELFCLLGANGAGKTTLINIFMDFLQPTSGQALVGDVDANKEPLRAKRHVSYLAENVRLYGNLTASQNVAFFAQLGHESNVTREGCEAILARTGLESTHFRQPLRTFSKGMRQKVGIAIALIRDSKAIYLDEPTSGLDPKAGAEFMELLNELRQENKAILMCTHDIFRASSYADRVGIMQEGRLERIVGRDELQSVDLEKLYLEHFHATGETMSGNDPAT